MVEAFQLFFLRFRFQLRHNMKFNFVPLTEVLCFVSVSDKPSSSSFPPVQTALREVSHLTLARYHLVSHPSQPTRLTKILLLTRHVHSVVNQENVISSFFGNDTPLVLLFVNNILLQQWIRSVATIVWGWVLDC